MSHATAAKMEATAPRAQAPGPSIREQLDATTSALVAAEEARLGDGLRSVNWERRGPLGRLVRRGPG